MNSFLFERWTVHFCTFCCSSFLSSLSEGFLMGRQLTHCLPLDQQPLIWSMTKMGCLWNNIRLSYGTIRAIKLLMTTLVELFSRLNKFKYSAMADFGYKFVTKQLESVVFFNDRQHVFTNKSQSQSLLTLQLIHRTLLGQNVPTMYALLTEPPSLGQSCPLISIFMMEKISYQRQPNKNSHLFLKSSRRAKMKIENFDQLKVFNKNFNRQRRRTIRNRIRATAVKKKTV